ncbi:tryptophan halogenase family protein [Asticcacaulis taihuensis]|uniref:tryptophan halogenase family protein n=1 Tax=Asticcacaulis taihuensis TaxID=260084 RepID=UPI003F7BAC92
MIKRVVVVGGGTAGWMTAAALSKVLGTRNHTITLVESEEIGTVGVGEATIPQIRLFNDLLGLDEDDFIRRTNGTFKLGIRFVDWRKDGQSYIHPFGLYGSDMDGIEFHHFMLRQAVLGGSQDYGRYNAEIMAIRAGRFGRTKTDASGLPRINYAYQFDASLYAAFLRGFAEARGAVRREGRIVRVHQDAESGDVTAVELQSGERIEGDLFIDCSGFRGLLIEETLKAGYEDWSQWLPCNRAAAVPSEKAEGPIEPYTRSTAREAGWQWHIPLQHRTGNGYVFSSEFISEDEAVARLLTRLEGKPLKDPKVLRFTTGRRRKSWSHNVLAFGLSSGFLEPLESTSIHLVQVGISKLLAMFPKTGIEPAVVDQYNREMAAEYINIKDFLIAHYHVTEREETPFWQYCRHMSIPDSLRERLDLFQSVGQSAVRNVDLFKEVSWFSVLVGQGMTPRDYHPIADLISEDELKQRLAQVRSKIQKRVDSLMSHDAFIEAHCKAAV